MYWLDKLKEQNEIAKCSHYYKEGEKFCCKCGLPITASIKIMDRVILEQERVRLKKYQKIIRN